MEKKISVIIVTYNSEKHIFDCLDSLFKYNDIGEALEVIIVDNQSSCFEETKQRLENLYGEKLIIIENEINGGYGQGNNVGVKASSAPFIMIMNPDVRLVEPLFKRALQSFSNPNVVQFGIRAIDKQGKTGCSIGLAANIHPYIGVPLFTVCNRMGWFFPRIMYLIGACFFIRKSTFERIGMFDERIFMYGEEEDIHYRMLGENKLNTIEFDKKYKYAHLHGLYSTSTVGDLSMYRNSLKNAVLIRGERGISKRTIIKESIAHVHLSLAKAYLSYLFVKDSLTKEYIELLKTWKKELKENL